MKKLMAGILAVVLVLTAGVSAAGRGHGAGNGAGRGAGHHGGYAGTHACCWVDGHGDGVCDACGRVPGQGGANGGRYWVDENNDGVCDNFGTASCGRGIFCGMGRRMRTVSVN